MEKSKSQTFNHSQIRQVQRKALYDSYTYFIDPSTIILEHYKKKDFYSGQQKYLHKINKWINNTSSSQNNTNKPLVFRTQPGVGVKTLLVNWQKQFRNMYTNKKEKCLTIMHFASSGSNNSNYFYSLYRIIIKLREALKLKQNVDLLEQKIRNYFPYWLDLCNSELERQLIINCAEEIYDKIIIVIEGVDRFIDPQNGKQASIAFWLPASFPKNIKVIVTASRHSQAIQHLQKNKCQIVDIEPFDQISNALLAKGISKKTILNSQTEKKLGQILSYLKNNLSNLSGLYSLIDVYCDCLMPNLDENTPHDIVNVIKEVIQKKTPFEQLKKIVNLKGLYSILIKLWTQHLPLKGRADLALKFLVLTQKGLNKKQIMNLTRFTDKEWQCFETAVGGLLTCYQGLYSIKSTSFSAVVMETQFILHYANGNHVQTNTQLHQKIANALQSTPNSIRKLEQQTYHLFVAKSYFKLKQMISNIQNFLLLFNPNNKYELSRYWQKLEEKGFDPVIEYNKAVQGFSMHYHPSDQNIFRIIVQISRFLKEFCDFQTYETPNFRHPYIEGNKSELLKIGLLKELSDLEIYVDNSFAQERQTQDITLQQQIKQLKQKYFPKDQNLQGSSTSNFITPSSPLNKANKARRKAQVKILSDIEQLNVDVPMNREKFRNFYLQGLQQFMKSQQAYASNSSEAEQEYFDIDDGGIIINSPQNVNYSFNKVRENYRLRQIKPSLYYYKRWIWIQFPWVCISLHNNYSNTPQLYCGLGQNFNSSSQKGGDDGDILQKQAKYTKQALIVAIEAKQKKKQMFSPKGTQNSFNSMMNNSKGYSISRFRGNFNSTAGKDMPNLGNSNNSKFSMGTTSNQFRSRALKAITGTAPPDLSLSALTKQLEVRKKQLQGTNQLKESSYESDTNNFGNALNQNYLYAAMNNNCEQDMKFITQRKKFHSPDLTGVQSSQILPKLKWMIKQHTNYELDYIQTHIEEKKKKLNKIIFQNKKLAQTYKQLKLKQNLNKKSSDDHDGQKNSKKNKVLEDLLQKKEQVITNFCKSLLQKQRLKIILKLCSENKTRNQQYLASLNYLLQNIKKMINWEKQNMKGISEQLQQIKSLQQRKMQIQAQQQKNQSVVERQAKNYLEQKQKLEKQIQNITSVIADDIRDQKHKLQNSLTGHIKNRQQKTIAMLQQKKTKQLEEKLQKVQKDYKSLQTLFQFDGFDFENAPKFQKLLEENQRNKKLKIAYFQRKNKLEQLIREHQKLKEQNSKQISIFENAKKDEQYEKNQAQQKQNKDQRNDTNKNKLKILLDNVALKLGVKSRQDIIPTLNKKLLQLKQNKKERYMQIMDPHFKPYHKNDQNRYGQNQTTSLAQ